MGIDVQIGREIGINLQTTGKRIGIGNRNHLVGVKWNGSTEYTPAHL